MLTTAAIAAVLIEKTNTSIPWEWQILLWGWLFLAAVKEYHYSDILFLIDVALFIALSTFCPALLPLGTDALVIAALFTLLKRASLNTDQLLQKHTKWITALLITLVLLDVFLVIAVYPRIKQLALHFTIPAYISGPRVGEWFPILGSGDYLVAGTLMSLLNMRWLQACAALTIALLACFYLPDAISQWLQFIPALLFIVPSFLFVWFLCTNISKRLPKQTEPLPLVSGRGAWGLYYLAMQRQNKTSGGDTRTAPVADVSDEGLSDACELPSAKANSFLQARR
ncbi:MAG: hypothetical protein RQ862_01645 [Candidatus Caldarchaeales archaeon]|nr:hypothetical protein [Candidatus Caldarchaeales archaeon]